MILDNDYENAEFYSGAVAIVFDGVITPHTTWEQPDVINGQPPPGIKEAIEQIRAAGHRVIVVSRRCEFFGGTLAVQEYLDEHGITVNEITAHNPPALCCIAPNYLQYNGDPLALLTMIENFSQGRNAMQDNNNVIYFYGTRGEFGCLSNFYPAAFTIDGTEYKWSEQYMMAEKARIFDPEKIHQIIAAKTPAECKRLGRKVKNFDSGIWDVYKEYTVYIALRAKFKQNSEIRQILLNTGDAILAEASPTDRIWGIGLNKSQAENSDPADWPGQNLLGKILMRVRDELKNEQ